MNNTKNQCMSKARDLAKQLLRDSLAILYFVIGWKFGGCLLSEHPRNGEPDRRPDCGAHQFPGEASETSAEPTAPFGEGVQPARGDASDADGADASVEFDGSATDEALPVEVQRGGVVLAGEVDGEVARAD